MALNRDFAGSFWDVLLAKGAKLDMIERAFFK
jgi:hypothetical protein